MGNYNTLLNKLQGVHSENLRVAALYRDLGLIGRAVEMEQCGSYLQIAVPSADPAGGSAAVIAANFCRQRFCPSCQWRRSMRIFRDVSRCMDWIEHQRSVKFLFLTLTVRNVVGGDLIAAVDQIMEGWHRLVNNRAWWRRILGSYRTLEVTRNPQTGTFHPHLHCLLCVDPAYGSKSNDLYLRTAEWSAMWANSVRADYLPHCWIESCRDKRAKQVSELTKYCCKSKDIHDADTLSIMSDALHGRRLIGYTGLFTKARRALSICDDDLVLDSDLIRGDVAYLVIEARWLSGGWKVREITGEEVRI